MSWIERQESFHTPLDIWKVLFIVGNIPDISLSCQFLLDLVQKEIFARRVDADFENLDFLSERTIFLSALDSVHLVFVDNGTVELRKNESVP